MVRGNVNVSFSSGMYLNHGAEEEATADKMNLLPLHDSEGRGEGQSSRSWGLASPTTTHEAQRATASTAAPPEQEWMGTRSGGHGSLLASSSSTSPLLPFFQQLPGGQTKRVTIVPPRSSCARVPHHRQPLRPLCFLGQSPSVWLLLLMNLLHQGSGPAAG